jgi:toxin CcdB
MAQFTVYKDKNPRSKTTYPLLVDAQAEFLDELRRRLMPVERRQWASIRW